VVDQEEKNTPDYHVAHGNRFFVRMRHVPGAENTKSAQDGLEEMHYIPGSSLWQ